jgi:peptidoglycan/LPS O-acetylase OafA/YrhL
VFESNPFAGAVNGSLWTLPVEVAMYAVVLALGVCGLLRPRLVAAAWVAFLLMHYRLADALGISKWVLFDALPLFHFFKLGAFFVAGSAMYLFRDRLRFHPGIAVALLAALVATVHTPAGPLTMHLALPWLVLHFAQMRVPGLAAFGRHGDFSYGIYVLAFPVQQATIATIGPQAGLAAFVAVSFAITLALSVVSWRLVEAPALRLKAKRPA